MKTKRILSLGLILALLLVLGSVFVPTVQAMSINPNGNLGGGQKVGDDLLLGGQSVILDGTVNGAVIAMGQTVTINGTINGDLITCGETLVVGKDAVVTGNIFACGRNITIAGTVQGSVFGGAAEMELGSGATVNRNVYFGGYSFSSEKGSTIGTDLRAGLHQAILRGDITKDAILNAGAVELYGKVGEDANITLSDSSKPNNTAFMGTNLPATIEPGLRVDANAEIAGKLVYSAAQKYAIAIQPVGGIVYHAATPAEHAQPEWGHFAHESASGFRTWQAISTLLTLLLAGALALGVFGRHVESVVSVAQSCTLASAGVGLLVLVLALPAFFMAALLIVVAGLLLSLVSLGGLGFPIFGLGFSALGLAAAGLIVLVTVVSKLIVAYLVGSLIFKSGRSKLSSFWQKALPLLVGVVIYAALAALPFVGWLFSFAAACIGLGALWFWLFPGKAAVQVQPPALNTPQ